MYIVTENSIAENLGEICRFVNFNFSASGVASTILYSLNVNKHNRNDILQIYICFSVRYHEIQPEILIDLPKVKHTILEVTYYD